MDKVQNPSNPEVIDVYSENRKEHIKAICGENVEFVNVKAGGRPVTAALQRVKLASFRFSTQPGFIPKA
jgi:hypothetical protein